MDDLVNKERGEVALPEAGEGVFLRFTVDSLEKLEAKYGENFIEVIMRRMSQGNADVFRQVLNATIGGDLKIPYMNKKDRHAFPGLPFEDLEMRIRDALYLCISGRTYEEQEEHIRQQMLKMQEKAEQYPRPAAEPYSNG